MSPNELCDAERVKNMKRQRAKAHFDSSGFQEMSQKTDFNLLPDARKIFDLRSSVSGRRYTSLSDLFVKLLPKDFLEMSACHSLLHLPHSGGNIPFTIRKLYRYLVTRIYVKHLQAKHSIPFTSAVSKLYSNENLEMKKNCVSDKLLFRYNKHFLFPSGIMSTHLSDHWGSFLTVSGAIILDEKKKPFKRESEITLNIKKEMKLWMTQLAVTLEDGHCPFIVKIWPFDDPKLPAKQDILKWVVEGYGKDVIVVFDSYYGSQQTINYLLENEVFFMCSLNSAWWKNVKDRLGSAVARLQHSVDTPGKGVQVYNGKFVSMNQKKSGLTISAYWSRGRFKELMSMVASNCYQPNIVSAPFTVPTINSDYASLFGSGSDDHNFVASHHNRMILPKISRSAETELSEMMLDMLLRNVWTVAVALKKYTVTRADPMGKIPYTQFLLDLANCLSASYGNFPNSKILPFAVTCDCKLCNQLLENVMPEGMARRILATENGSREMKRPPPKKKETAKEKRQRLQATKEKRIAKEAELEKERAKKKRLREEKKENKEKERREKMKEFSVCEGCNKSRHHNKFLGCTRCERWFCATCSRRSSQTIAQMKEDDQFLCPVCRRKKKPPTTRKSSKTRRRIRK